MVVCFAHLLLQQMTKRKSILSSLVALELFGANVVVPISTPLYTGSNMDADGVAIFVP